MGASFNCPNYGAALEYPGIGRTMPCQYCGTPVQVPGEYWREAEQRQTAAQWKKWIAIFPVLTVGLPTCLGLFGAILGIGGSIFAAAISLILRIFIH
jgi:hypothetical protein